MTDFAWGLIVGVPLGVIIVGLCVLAWEIRRAPVVADDEWGGA